MKNSNEDFKVTIALFRKFNIILINYNCIKINAIVVKLYDNVKEEKICNC